MFKTPTKCIWYIQYIWTRPKCILFGEKMHQCSYISGLKTLVTTSAQIVMINVIHYCYQATECHFTHVTYLQVVLVLDHVGFHVVNRFVLEATQFTIIPLYYNMVLSSFESVTTVVYIQTLWVMSSSSGVSFTTH